MSISTTTTTDIQNALFAPFKAIGSLIPGVNTGTAGKPINGSQSIADRVNDLRSGASGYGTAGRGTPVPQATTADVLAGVNTLSNSQCSFNNLASVKLDDNSQLLQTLLKNQNLQNQVLLWQVQAQLALLEHCGIVMEGPSSSLMGNDKTSTSQEDGTDLAGAAATSAPKKEKRSFLGRIFKSSSSSSSSSSAAAAKNADDANAGACMPDATSVTATVSATTASSTSPDMEKKIKADADQLKKDDDAAVAKKAKKSKKDGKSKDVKAGASDDILVAVGQTADGNVIVAEEMSEATFEALANQ